MLGNIESRRRRDDRGWDGWMASPTHGHEFEQALGVDDREGGLVCCSPWGHKETDRTERLNWTELNWFSHHLCVHSTPILFFENLSTPSSKGYFLDSIPRIVHAKNSGLFRTWYFSGHSDLFKDDQSEPWPGKGHSLSIGPHLGAFRHLFVLETWKNLERLDPNN